jgi:hypothetical protein
MQKIQILFPAPLMERLRLLSAAEDRPVSEVVRRAVERDLEQRAAFLKTGGVKPAAFPTFDGGKVLVEAAQLKDLLHADDLP